jgi:hypothetical protein
MNQGEGFGAGFCCMTGEGAGRSCLTGEGAGRSCLIVEGAGLVVCIVLLSGGLVITLPGFRCTGFGAPGFFFPLPWNDPARAITPSIM